MFPEIESDPEEIDTQVILYYLNAERKSYRNVVVLSSYSDLFFMKLSFISD